MAPSLEDRSFSKLHQKTKLQTCITVSQQAGRDIELCNSFELDYNVIDGVVVIDRDYYNTKEEQFKQAIC